MRTEAAPRNCAEPGKKLGQYNGWPSLLLLEAATNRNVVRTWVAFRMRSPASVANDQGRLYEEQQYEGEEWL